MADEENKGNGLMGSSSSKRQRFYIELKPGETAIVSWKKLVKDAAKEKVVVGVSSSGHHSSSSASDTAFRVLDDNSQVGSQCNDSSVRSERPKHKNGTTSSDNQQLRKRSRRVEMTKVEVKPEHSFPRRTEKIAHEKTIMKMEVEGESPNVMDQRFARRSIPSQTNPRSRNLTGDKNIEVLSKSKHNEKSGQSMGLFDAVSPGCKSSLKDSVSTKDVCVAVNDNTRVKPFSYVLERAIKELEKTVAAYSFEVEALDVHTAWLTIERKLPFEVMLKIGKVARIAKSSQETFSKELVSRLVSILRKLVRGKTIKRILRKVVIMKLSLWKDKAEKFREIKDEILEMVYNRQNRAGHSSKGKEEETFSERYKLDGAMEEKLCDLYESCVQGLGGEEGVQVQDLFVELAKLWPKGVMDHLKLREAVNRAKRKRMSADKNQVQTAGYNEKSVGSTIAENANRNGDPVPSLTRQVTDTGNNCGLVSSPHSKASLKQTAKDRRAKSSYLHIKGPKPNMSARRNVVNAGVHSHPMEQRAAVADKMNVKIRFHLKPQDGIHKSGERAAEDTLNLSRAAASLTCKQLS